MGEVDVEVHTKIAALVDIIFDIVLLLDVGKRSVTEERAIECSWIGTSSSQPLLRDHCDGALDTVGHDISGTLVLFDGACWRSPAAVTCNSNHLWSTLGLVHHNNAEGLAQTLLRYALAC